MTRDTVHPLLARRSSDEYEPQPWSARDRRALARFSDRLSETEVEPHDRRATATMLRAVDIEAGGGFYDVPADAERDLATAQDALGQRADDGAVIDVQTHLVRPSRWHGSHADALASFLVMNNADRWGGGIDPQKISGVAWATHVFGESETAMALLTSPPGPEDENLISNPDIAAARDIIDRYAGSGRVLTHSIVHPNIDGEFDRMQRWANELRPSAWKTYTMWEPPGTGKGGWFLDDEETGLPFIEHVRHLGATGGPTIICSHKGIGGPIASASPAKTSPRDIGPAAKQFPDVRFVVYHSGYELDVEEEGSVADDPQRGASRLVTSLEQAGVGPGSNVYAELGTTWFCMVRRPREAAHVLGKMLQAVGPERILWGTDSTWYGSPQPLIDAFRAFQIPEWMQERYGYPALDSGTKDAILGGNSAALYGVSRSALRALGPSDLDGWLENARNELRARLD